MSSWVYEGCRDRRSCTETGFRSIARVLCKSSIGLRRVCYISGSSCRTGAKGEIGLGSFRTRITGRVLAAGAILALRLIRAGSRVGFISISSQCDASLMKKV